VYAARVVRSKARRAIPSGASDRSAVNCRLQVLGKMAILLVNLGASTMIALN
jgi:hypothetical protein